MYIYILIWITETLIYSYTEDCKICTSFRENLEKLSELPESEFGTVINFGLVNANSN